MLKKRHYIGFLALSSLVVCAAAQASTASGTSSSTSSTTAPTATTSPAPSGGSAAVSTEATLPSTTTAVTAQPQAVPAGLAADATDNHKHFTVTATLREEYDDNIFTAKTGRVSSAVTQLAPTVLYDLPTEYGDFSLRDTFGADYYSNRPGGQFDFSDEFVAQYQHAFSERFSLNVAEQFRYYTQPSLFQSVGTQYYNGAYINNIVNAGFNAQWTPLLSTQTTYANTVVDYMDSSTATQQNSVENTATQSFGFAILPKINLVFGGIIDAISYDSIDRGYISYTGNTGIDWQALPSLSLGVRVGGTVIDADQTGTSTTPYASFVLNWKLGARSSLSFSYSHDVVPSDVYLSDGQIADRFSTIFRYDITSRISTHLEGIFTYGQYTSQLLANSTPAFDEEDYAVDTGFTYHYNTHLDFDIGYIFSGVSSGESYRDYTRNQVFVGVRGTY